MLEGEKTQLQNQISNLNASVITMKEELSHHSDEMLEKDRVLREKEQVIAELGTMIKTLQANIVVLFFQINSQKNLEEEVSDKENQLVRFEFFLLLLEPHREAERIHDRRAGN